MRDNKGQALVEFIIILPIFLLLILSVIDFGNIISKKYSLENDIDVVVSLYKEEKSTEINNYIKKNNLKINFTNEGELFVIKLEKDVKVMSPMLNLIFGKTYQINVEKSIYKNE